MGLTLKTTMPTGLEVDNAYHKITEIFGNKKNIRIKVSIYLSQDNSDNNYDELYNRYFDFVPSLTDNSTNFIKQGYEYLKTLPEFKNYTEG